nr:gluconate:H+ symporter [uncultured Merdimonas sp.]
MGENMLLAAFLVSLAAIIFSVVKLKLHPFLSLLIGSLLMGFLSGIHPNEILEGICAGFGGTMGDVGILILLGVILGELLHNSGATRNIAGRLLKLFGVANTPLAINITGYLICIPVFFDAAFVILIDLMRQLSQKGKIALNVLVCALAIGMTMTHAMVIPTPGPVAVAGIVGANIAWFIFYSIIVSLPASLIGGVLYGKYLKRHPAWGNALEDEQQEVPAKAPETAEEEGASGTTGIFLILLPIVLIILGTVLQTVVKESAPVYPVIQFCSDTNVILLFTIFLAFFILRRYLTASFNDLTSTAAESVGSIIAIICAGGAFGEVIGMSGLGDYLVESMRSLGIPLIVLAYLLTQVLRMGLGSITVSLVTTAAVVAPLIAQTGDSPVLVGLAVCAGGVGLCMPNDSSFWTINKFSKFSFGETVRVLTVPGTIAGITGFCIILVLYLFRSVLPGL